MKKLFALMLAALMIVSLAACGSAPTATEAPPAATEAAAKAPAEEAKKVIGINIGNPQYETFQIVERSLTDACKAHGWDYIVTYGTNEQIIENYKVLLAQNVDAIACFGVNADTGSAATELAAAEGVPVVSIDVQYNGAYYFGANNQRAGEVTGEALAEHIKSKFNGEVDMIVHFYTESNGPEVLKRNTGAQDAIEAALGRTFTDDELFWFDVQDDTLAKQNAIDFLSAHPDMDNLVFITCSDAWGPSIESAIEMMDRVDDVLMGTQNESNYTIDNFLLPEENSWVCSSAYYFDRYGDYVMNIIEDLFNGKEVPELSFMDHEAITRENAAEFKK